MSVFVPAFLIRQLGIRVDFEETLQCRLSFEQVLKLN